MSTIQIVIGVIVASVLAFLFLRQTLGKNAKRLDQGREQFETVLPLFDTPEVLRGKTVGVWTLTGRYRDHRFQLKTVVDTLATRKLPSLWLMVTLPELLPVSGTTNLMMRAAGVTSFSNFDFLAHTLQTPDGFPAHAVLRTEDLNLCPSPEVLRPYLELFENRHGKEFLVSPKGLRIVVLVAEVDRLRYGVFREADFGGTVIDADITKHCLDALLALNESLKA